MRIYTATRQEHGTLVTERYLLERCEACGGSGRESCLTLLPSGCLGRSSRPCARCHATGEVASRISGDAGRRHAKEMRKLGWASAILLAIAAGSLAWRAREIFWRWWR